MRVVSGFKREKPLTQSRRAGFTLVELMVVTALLGILASIALPKFGNMIIKAKEAAVRKNLYSVRSAIAIYYADNEGLFPTTAGTLRGKYIHELPIIQIPKNPEHRGNIASVTVPIGNPSTDWEFMGSPCAWRSEYKNPPARAEVTFINCTHLDTSGRTWSTW